jgi:hypothetical protein
MKTLAIALATATLVAGCGNGKVADDPVRPVLAMQV